ncbi:hypothetical protein RJ639_009545 [Escallonia herrerae]|uniref:NB-ARC domain-containing protein n=1 Tax=Escallonia herrerae TaxID=1293975 RepID=A0AA88VS48_9ASTE|nr:hypothetical protein RJ639_009545 [Escallonia herrerae]
MQGISQHRNPISEVCCLYKETQVSMLELFDAIKLQEPISTTCAVPSLNISADQPRKEEVSREGGNSKRKWEMGDISSSFLAKVAEYMMAPVERQFKYLLYSNSNIEDLNDQVIGLENMRAGVQLSVNAAKRNLEVIGSDVEAWLNDVENIKKEADRILEGRDKVKNSPWWSPHLGQRYVLGRKAMKKTEVVIKLQGKGNKYTKLSYPAPPTEIISALSNNSVGFESRISTTKNIIKAMKDDEIIIIGICGMGGVGKTTMAKEVREILKVENIFHESFMVVVSQSQDIKKIQGQLAEKLDLHFWETTIPGRADKLRARLSTGLKCLVVLDDVWEGLDLNEVGIPVGGVNNCKVILTSRNENVCLDMGSQINFSVQVLMAHEAWNLFKEMAGDCVDTDDLHSIAKEVVRECGGLPIAIVTLGKALKYRKKHAWDDVLQQLQKCSITNIPEMENKVYASIELSYKYLKSNQAQSLLLLCCLFSEDEDIPIEYLVRYWFGLRLFNDVGTLRESRNRVETLLDELKSCFLLLDIGEGYVKMHDVVRDACLLIASKGEHKYMVRQDNKLQEWPKNDSYQPYTAISLMSDEVQVLATGLDCPQLKLLRLICGQGSLNISRDFFQGMNELDVFDFKGVLAESLPPSLQFLTNLRTLCLNFCRIRSDIALIGSLKKLEILSFFGSELDIGVLPIEIGQLTNLRLLDLRCTYGPYRIPSIVFSSLNQLEELYVGCYFRKSHITSEDNAIILNLKLLSSLKTLQIWLPHVLLRNIHKTCFNNLTRFEISVYREDMTQSSTMLRSVWGHQFQNRVTLDRMFMQDLHATKVLLRQTEVLYLRVPDLKNLVEELEQEGFVKLRSLQMSSCSEVKYLLDAKGSLPRSTFINLEELELEGMGSLREICYGNLPAGSFGRLEVVRLRRLPALGHLWKAPIQPPALSNLKFLTIRYCGAISSLFQKSVAKCLVQIEDLNVFSCNMMKELVLKESGDEHSEKIEFPKLKFLMLNDLPKLRTFYPDSVINKQPFLNQQVLLPSMETLDIAALDNLVQIFGAQVQTGSLHKLRVMRLNNCDKLLNVAVSDSIRVLPNLVELEVKFCSSLESVFDFEGLRVLEEDAQAMLSQLETLKLSNLSLLSDICKKVPTETQCFQNLRSLHIDCCNSLRYLLSYALAKLLLNLQNIRLKECEMIEEIITGEEGSSETCVMSGVVFPQLRILELEDLNNLRLFCASTHNFEFPLLDKVLIRNCPSMNTFCSGLVSAPKLDQLNVGNDQRVRMDNLNNAIHRMKEKCSSINGSCDMDLLQEIERSEFKEKGILNMSEFIDAGYDASGWLLDPKDMLEDVIEKTKNGHNTANDDLLFERMNLAPFRRPRDTRKHRLFREIIDSISMDGNKVVEESEKEDIEMGTGGDTSYHALTLGCIVCSFVFAVVLLAI